MKNNIMTDVHCHILPGIDDGAQYPDISGALLLSEHQQGIRQILFTPHFYAHDMKVEDYCRHRAAAYESMKETIGRLGLETALGAEVRMDEELFDIDFTDLRMGDSRYLLLEWPFLSGTFPLWGEEIVDILLRQGLTPVFAHIDRYDYFFGDEERLYHFLEKGCLFQVNADSCISRRRSPRVFELMKEGLVHIVGSDAHNTDKRPCHLKSAMEGIEKKLGSNTVEFLMENADAIFHDREIDGFKKPKRKKVFGIF